MQDSGKTQGKIARHASIMAGGTLLSRVLGLMRDVILANAFDRTVSDAWLVAFRFPNFFRRLLGEGALANSFVPVYVELHKDRAEANQLVQSIYALLLVALCTAVSLGVLFCDPLIRLWVGGSGFQSVPGKMELTIQMARIMFGFLFAISHFAFFMAILNAHKRFAMAALAPCFFNLAVIAASLMAPASYDQSANWLAWGVVVGGFLQAGVLIPQLVGLNVLFFPRLCWNPQVRRVLVNMVPGMIGMGIVQFTALVNTAYTSNFSEGAHTWIYLADRILEFPLSLIAVSIGSALLPTLAENWANNDVAKFVDNFSDALALNLFLSIPAAIGIFFLSERLASLLFLWSSQVSALDIGQVSQVLAAYSLLVIFAGLVRVTAPAFFAQKNTWLPAGVSLLAFFIHLILAPLLMGQFQLMGLIYSVVVSAAVNWLCLIFLLRRRLSFNLFSLAPKMVPMLPGFFLVFSLCFVADFLPKGKLTTLGLVAINALAYFWVGSLCGVGFAKKVVSRLSGMK